MGVTLTQPVEKLLLNKYVETCKGGREGRVDFIYVSYSPLKVAFVIDDATSHENLCQLYEGWTPWV